MIQLLLLFFTLMDMAHPIHVSKCQIEAGVDQRLQIILHVFVDDLEDAILQNRSSNPDKRVLRLGTKREESRADSLILDYVRHHLVISNPEHPISYNWIGKELSDDFMAFWIYLESEPVIERQGYRIRYSLLHDLFADQKNILNLISSDGDERYFLSRPGDDTTTFDHID